MKIFLSVRILKENWRQLIGSKKDAEVKSLTKEIVAHVGLSQLQKQLKCMISVSLKREIKSM